MEFDLEKRSWRGYLIFWLIGGVLYGFLRMKNMDFTLLTSFWMGNMALFLLLLNVYIFRMDVKYHKNQIYLTLPVSKKQIFWGRWISFALNFCCCVLIAVIFGIIGLLCEGITSSGQLLEQTEDMIVVCSRYGIYYLIVSAEQIVSAYRNRYRRCERITLFFVFTILVFEVSMVLLG